MKTLQVSQLGHRFALVEVLTDINLELGPGQTLALVGPSGCGKSTLLHLIAGLLTPSEGRIANSFSNMACMFQQPLLLPWQKAMDNLVFGLKARGMRRQQRFALGRQLGSQLGLEQDDLDKYPHELSGGMQSRIALGRALITRPDLLLLDEPFSALDIGLKLELYALLRQHITERSSAVLMITHDLMEAVRLADRIIMMAPSPGHFIGEFSLQQSHPQRSDAWIYQTTAELMANPSIRSGFGLPTGSLEPTEHTQVQHSQDSL